MYYNKFTRKDPLSESVRQVMIENDIRRQVELTLNEQLGIQSRKQLPHELHESYDNTLKEAIHNALNENCGWSGKKMEEESDLSPKQKKLASLGGNPKEIDAPDLAAARKGHASKVGLEEGIKQLVRKMNPLRRINAEKKVVDSGERSRERGQDSHNASMNRVWPNKRVDRLRQTGFGRNKSVEEEANVALGKNPITRKDPAAPQAIEEKITQKTSASKIISDFVHSKDPKFAGKSTKERQQMALGAYYGKHPEKSRKQMDESLQSILEEIQSNLEEQFIQIYESNNYELMEEFLDSLTEEQAELLGLNEADTTNTEFTRHNVLGPLLNRIKNITPNVRELGQQIRQANQPTSPSTRPIPHQNVVSPDVGKEDNIPGPNIAAARSAKPEPTSASSVTSTAATPAKNSTFDMGKLDDKTVTPAPAASTTPARPAPATSASTAAPRPQAERPAQRPQRQASSDSGSSFSGPSGRAGFGDRGSDFGA